MSKTAAKDVMARLGIAASFGRTAIAGFDAALSRIQPKYRRTLSAALLLAGITYVLFSPVFDGYTLSDVASRRLGLYPWAYSTTERLPPMHYDQADTFHPWQVFMNEAVKNGEFPLWNPYSFAGHPFFANGQNGFLYFPRTYLSLIATPARVHDVLIISHLLLGGIMMFVLLADLRLSFGASFFGSVAWMINSFMLAWMFLEHYVVIHAWLPLALLLMRRAVRRRSVFAAAGLGLVLALIFLGGNVLFVVITFVTLGFYGLYLFARQLRAVRRGYSGLNSKRALTYAAIVAIPAVLTGGLIAVQFLPTWDIVRTIERPPLTYTELVKWRLPVSELASFFRPPIYKGGFAAEDPYHRMLFLGTPTALLALLGLWRRHHLAKFARALAVVVILVAIGTPLAWVAFKLIPGFGHLKPLARILFLFNFAAAILASFGMDWLLRRGPRWIRWHPQRMTAALWRFLLTAGAVTVVLVQLFKIGDWVIRYELNQPGSLYPETPLIKALNVNDDMRILAVHPSFYGSTSMAFGIHNAGGYESVLPNRISRLWRFIQGGPAGEAASAPATAVATMFSFDSRFDLLARLSVSHVVTPPLIPVSGCKGMPPPATAGRFESQPVPEKWSVVVGDWNGDGLDSFGFYDPDSATFHLLESTNPDSSVTTFQLGQPGLGWRAIAGDWDAKGSDSVGVYDPLAGAFHLRNASGAVTTVHYGKAGSGWIPIAGDWNADRADTIGLYDPINSHFHLLNSTRGRPEDEVSFPFLGAVSGHPVVGDWDGDGSDSVGLYFPDQGRFYLRLFNTGGNADLEVRFGLKGEELRPFAGIWKKDVSRARADVVGLRNVDLSQFYFCTPSFFGDTRLERIYSARDGEVYKVPDPLPRAFAVHRCLVAESGEDAFRLLSDKSFDASSALILEKADLDGEPPRATGSKQLEGEAVSITHRSANSIKLEVKMLEDGWVVVNESWEKGWTATLDGDPVRVLPANYAFRAIRVPAGDHTIEMIYSPESFRVGRIISGGTLLVLVVAGVVWGIRGSKTANGKRS